MKTFIAVAALLLAACASFSAAQPETLSQASARCAAGGDTKECLADLERRFAPMFAPAADFSVAGPYRTRGDSEGPECAVFRPETLGEGGVRHPIVVWGNGTGQSPRVYAGLLIHWASHGFVVIAANTSNPGRGTEMLACLDYLIAENARDDGPYAHKLNPYRIATSGHSQGGGGSIMAGRDPRVITTAPLEPYIAGLGYQRGAHTSVTTPMLLLSGGNDTIASPARNQQPVFDEATVPVFWATLKGASHMVPMRGDAGPFRTITLAWFRARLMADAQAARMFDGEACGFCTSADWEVQKRGL